jgi:16S rRNA (cytosine967-C5)-methyltransferase
VLVRIERDGAYANLALGPVLERSGLDRRDRGLVTELVYGTTRMRRTCDWLVDRFVTRAPDDATRAALRVGAYQLVILGLPAHAAVSATVGATPRRVRGFVNAVLRRVAEAGSPERWPSEGIRLSYPDWIVAWAERELGEHAIEVLEHQNRIPTVTERPDGYVQDRASQWVVGLFGPGGGAGAVARVADLCAAPGGKATALAAAGWRVLASDRRDARVGLVAANARRLGLDSASLVVLAADGRYPPYPPGALDAVLLDAPCSGLGVLRRRPDARWRIQEGDVAPLARLQHELVDAAVPLLKPGGRLVYSVCTLTEAETLGIDEHLAARHPELTAVPPPGAPWQAHGRGAWLLPHWADTDGMFALVLGREDT